MLQEKFSQPEEEKTIIFLEWCVREAGQANSMP